MRGMEADLAAVAVLIADPSRAAMLDGLTGGMPLTAGELARLAGVARSTASEHLERLERGGLVVSERRGRSRHVRLAGPEIARALEALAAIAPPKRTNGLRAWQHGQALRAARSCYDHLAGETGVALADALLARRLLEPGNGGFAITPAGEDELGHFGLDVAAIRAARRATARPCLDWSERRPHVAGALGAALLRELLERRWLRRRTDGRALTLTREGAAGLASTFGVSLATIGTNSTPR
jgi:DNA-binding transcriptional ArsR family regulator